MFAVIKTGGKQYKVQEGDILDIEKIGQDEGKKVTFDEVLLIEADGKTMIGTPFVKNAQIDASVVENFKGDKVLVFKKKRRKQYRRTRGHRQELTRIKIEKIVVEAKKEKAEEKKPDAAAKPVSKTGAPKKAAEKKTPAKPAAAKKTAAAKKPAAAKTPAAVKKPAAKPKAAVKTTEAKDKKE
jgi:large subunit ribosomal protein L21